jgi:hypothetical protein
MKPRPIWRIAAISAVLLYTVLLGAVLVLLARNLWLGIVLALTAVTALYGAWLAFTTATARPARGWWLLVASGIALGAELIYLFSDERNRRAAALIVALSLLYGGLAAALRQKYWQYQRAHAGNDHANFTSPWLIINPKSGNGRAIKAHVDTRAADMGIHVLLTNQGDDVEQLARRAAAGGADVLGISGGDGSIGAVAKVAIEKNLPVIVLPGGTKCHFARDLGLSPKRITDSLAAFHGVERRVDIGSINGRIF